MFDPLMILVATQIIVESLPISSSGHMMIVAMLLAHYGIASPLATPDFFDHFLHGPTMVIIAWYFCDAWMPLVRMAWTAARAWLRSRCCYAALRDSHKRAIRVFAGIAGLVIIADMVTTACYGLIKVLLKDAQFLQSMPALICGFGVTGLLLFSTHWCKKSRGANGLSAYHALVLGLVQGLALLPGISRFASTLVIGQWLGMSPRRSLQFSFLMFFPLTVAAFFFKGLAPLLKYADAALFLQPSWLLVYCASSVAAYIIFAGACWMVLRDKLWWFGLYMAVPILSVILLGTV